MSRLIQQWLNEKVCLTRTITDFGKDFGNGYLLGELLYRFNQQPDFEHFKDSERIHFKLENFCRLEPTFRRIGVKGFDSNTAMKILDSDSKVCIELIYKIQVALNSIRVVVGKHRDEDFMPGNFVALTNLPQRQIIHSYDEVTSGLFGKSLSVRIKSQNQVDMEKHLKPFTDEKKRQDENVERLKELDRQQVEMYYQEIRARKIQNKKAELEYLTEWHEKGVGIWVENQRRRKYIQQVEKRHQNRVLMDKQQKFQKQLFENQVQVVQGLDEMDERIEEMDRTYNLILNKEKQEHGVVEEEKQQQQQLNREEEEEEDPITLDDLFVKREEGILPLSINSKTDSLIKKLVTTRHDIPGEDPNQVKTYLQNLRFRKGSSALTKEKRSSRRLKFLTELKDELEKNLNDRQIVMLQEKLRIPSKQESSIENVRCERDNYSKIVEENRIYREKQYEEFVEKEKQLEQLRIEKAEIENQKKKKNTVKFYQNHICRIESSKTTAEHKNAESFCRSLLNSIVEVALANIHQNILTEKKTDGDTIHQDKLSILFQADTNDKLDDYELDEYLKGTSLWKVEEDMVHKEIGDFVNTFRLKIMDPTLLTEKRRATIAAPKRRFKIQLVISGLPLCGKSSLAWRLASKYNLHIINPSEAVFAHFGESLEKNRITDEMYVDAIVKSIQKLGDEQVEREYANEEKLSSTPSSTAEDDDMNILHQLFEMWDGDRSGYIDREELLAVAIKAHVEGKNREQVEKECEVAFNQLDFDLNGQISWEEFSKYFQQTSNAKAIGELKQATTGENKPPINGWILDGFPTTRQQAKLLEFALSGKDIDRVEYQPENLVTLPANEPKKLDPSLFLNKGGVDGFFVIDMDKNTCLENASHYKGQERFRIAPAILQYEKQKDGLKEWYSTFGSYVEINHTNLEFAFEQVDGVLNRKQVEDEQKKKEQERSEYIEKCMVVKREWISNIGETQDNIKTIVDDVEKDANSLAVEKMIHKCPPFCFKTMNESGILINSSDLLLPQDEWVRNVEFHDLLVDEPEKCCTLAKAYRESEEGSLFALAYNWFKTCEYLEIEISFDLFENKPEEFQGEPTIENIISILHLNKENIDELFHKVWSYTLDTCKKKKIKKIIFKDHNEMENEKPTNSNQDETSFVDGNDEEQNMKKFVQNIETADKSFTTGLKECFTQTRKLREEWVDKFVKERVLFDELLRDRTIDKVKNNKLKAFQEAFDAIEDEIRFDPKTKAELYNKIEDVALALWEIIQNRKSEAESILQEHEEDPWVDSFIQRNCDQFIHIFQLEVTRYQMVRGSLEQLIKLSGDNKNNDDEDENQTDLEIYKSLWPVSQNYGQSLDPEVVFVDESSPEEKLDIALKSVQSLCSKMKNGENKILSLLDRQFIVRVTGLHKRASEKIKTYQQFTLQYRENHQARINERFDEELAAVEALVLFTSKKVENATKIIVPIQLLETNFLF